MLKVLFVVPRMHPNLREIHSAVVAAGGECKFIVAEVGPSEPNYFPDRLLLTKKTSDPKSINRILIDHKIDLVLQRSFRGGMAEVWSSSKKLKIKTFVYDQLPTSMSLGDLLTKPRRYLSYCVRILVRRLILGPHERLSPVAPWSPRASVALDNATHFRFPMAEKNRSSGLERMSHQRVVCIAKHGQHRKRVRWLLRAVEKSGSDFELTLIGSSPLQKSQINNHNRTLKRISRLASRFNQVTVLTDVSKDVIHDVLSEATLFVLPSRSEPYAISPLEAMAHQVPALISSDSGSVDYVRQVSNSLVFRSWSYRDFEKKLFLLLQDHKFRADLSQKVADILRKNHDPRTFVQALTRLRDRRLHPA